MRLTGFLDALWELLPEGVPEDTRRDLLKAALWGYMLDSPASSVHVVGYIVDRWTPIRERLINGLVHKRKAMDASLNDALSGSFDMKVAEDDLARHPEWGQWWKEYAYTPEANISGGRSYEVTLEILAIIEAMILERLPEEEWGAYFQPGKYMTELRMAVSLAASGSSDVYEVSLDKIERYLKHTPSSSVIQAAVLDTRVTTTLNHNGEWNGKAIADLRGEEFDEVLSLIRDAGLDEDPTFTIVETVMKVEMVYGKPFYYSPSGKLLPLSEYVPIYEVVTDDGEQEYAVRVTSCLLDIDSALVTLAIDVQTEHGFRTRGESILPDAVITKRALTLSAKVGKAPTFESTPSDGQSLFHNGWKEGLPEVLEARAFDPQNWRNTAVDGPLPSHVLMVSAPFSEGIGNVSMWDGNQWVSAGTTTFGSVRNVRGWDTIPAEVKGLDWKDPSKAYVRFLTGSLSDTWIRVEAQDVREPYSVGDRISNRLVDWEKLPKYAIRATQLKEGSRYIEVEHTGGDGGARVYSGYARVSAAHGDGEWFYVRESLIINRGGVLYVEVTPSDKVRTSVNGDWVSLLVTNSIVWRNVRPGAIITPDLGKLHGTMGTVEFEKINQVPAPDPVPDAVTESTPTPEGVKSLDIEQQRTSDLKVEIEGLKASILQQLGVPDSLGEGGLQWRAFNEERTRISLRGKEGAVLQPVGIVSVRGEQEKAFQSIYAHERASKLEKIMERPRFEEQSSGDNQKEEEDMDPKAVTMGYAPATSNAAHTAWPSREEEIKEEIKELKTRLADLKAADQMVKAPESKLAVVAQDPTLAMLWSAGAQAGGAALALAGQDAVIELGAQLLAQLGSRLAPQLPAKRTGWWPWARTQASPAALTAAEIIRTEAGRRLAGLLGAAAVHYALTHGPAKDLPGASIGTAAAAAAAQANILLLVREVAPDPAELMAQITNAASGLISAGQGAQSLAGLFGMQQPVPEAVDPKVTALFAAAAKGMVKERNI